MKDTPKKRWQILSGSMLKLLAMITMLIDHVACYLLSQEPALLQPLFHVGSTQVTWLYILRTIGRLSFPLYCFLLTEGFVYTRNRKRYGITLLLFALISELPWNFVHSGTWFYDKQNVFFTLFFGYCVLCMIEHLMEHPVIQIAGILGIFVLAYFFKADYDYMGVAAIMAMYLLRKQAIPRAAVCTCLFSATWRAGLAFIPIGLYNGERGFIKGRIGKYICYAFYPSHILILGVLKFCVLTS